MQWFSNVERQQSLLVISFETSSLSIVAREGEIEQLTLARAVAALCVFLDVPTA